MMRSRNPIRQLFHFIVAMQSAARKKTLYNTIRDDRTEIQLSVVFILILPIIAAHYLYLEETGNLKILRHETIRYLSVGIILVISSILVHLLFRRYSKELEIEYREDSERVGSPWTFWVYAAIVAVESIGWVVFTSTR